MPRLESWQSLEFTTSVGGAKKTIHTLMHEVGYSDAVDVVVEKGSSGSLHVVEPSYTPGTGSLTLAARWLRTFIADLTNNGETRVSDHDILMTVAYSPRGADVIVDEVQFIITGLDDSASSGSADAVKTTVPFQITKRVKRNGVEL